MRFYLTDMIGLPEAAALAKERGLGVESIRFSIGSLLDRLSPELETFRGELAGFSGPLSLHGPFLDLHPASCDPLIRAAARTRFQSAYDAAQSLGAAHLVCHTGWLPVPYGFGDWLPEATAFWREFLRDKDDTVQIHIENVFERDWRPLAALIDAIDLPFVTACLDVGHCGIRPQYPAEEWIRGLGGRIGHVHLHNNDGVRDRHAGLEEGILPIGELLPLLAEIAPDAGVLLEIPDPAALERSLGWLAREGWLPPNEISPKLNKKDGHSNG